MNKRFLSFLLNHYVISLVITLIIISVLPDYFTKYKIVTVDEKYVNAKENSFRAFYVDLDGDGKSEYLQAQNNTNRRASFMMYSSSGDLIDQFNFSDPFPNGQEFLWFLDADRNGFKEVYAITQREDSLFLNVIEPMKDNGIQFDEIYIDRTFKYKGAFQVYVSNGYALPSSSDIQEVVFGIYAGYPIYPRNFYKFNLKSSKITKSPYLTNVGAINFVGDINGDGFSEIVSQNHSSGNDIDSIYSHRSDYSSWITVLDKDLNFLFEPIEVAVPFSSLMVDHIQINNENRLICLVNSRNDNLHQDQILLVDLNGTILSKKELPPGKYQLELDSITREIICVNTENGVVNTYDYDLIEKKSFEINNNNSNFDFIDIDNNGRNEWIEYSLNKSKITIRRTDFEHPVSVNIVAAEGYSLYSGLKETRKGHQFYIQSKNNIYVFSYLENPYFLVKYLVYIGIYLVILGVILLVLKGYRMRLQRQVLLREEIVTLQLKSFKNQMDPHFTFNVFNTMANQIMTENPESLESFMEFSNLIRKSLESSNSISRSLKDEISHLKSYLNLEQLRFPNKFLCSFNIHPIVDMDFHVPKMLFQTYVENAIKHGILPKGKDGKIRIDINKDKSNILIAIEDNGIGRKKAKEIGTSGTGFGLEIMNEYFNLLNQYNKHRITHEIIDLFEKSGESSGTLVKINIPLKMSYQLFGQR